MHAQIRLPDLTDTDHVRVDVLVYTHASSLGDAGLTVHIHREPGQYESFQMIASHELLRLIAVAIAEKFNLDPADEDAGEGAIEDEDDAEMLALGW